MIPIEPILSRIDKKMGNRLFFLVLSLHFFQKTHGIREINDYLIFYVFFPYKQVCEGSAGTPRCQTSRYLAFVRVGRGLTKYIIT